MFKKKGLFLSLLILLLLLVGCSNNKRSSTIEGVEDLPGKKIGVQLGTAEDLGVSSLEGTIVDRYNSPYDAIQALIQDKVDCVIMNEYSAEAFVEKNDSLKILDEEYGIETTAICVAKNNDELTEKLNKAIADIKADGTLDRILKNYLDDDYEGTYHYRYDEDIDRSKGALVVATNAEFEPYEYIEDNEFVGIDMDLSREIADRLNMGLVIDDMQFASIINAVSSGKADVGIAGMAITEERLKSVDFTDPLYESARQVIIVHDGNNSVISSLQDRLYDNFIKDDRYKSLLKGLGTTLLIAAIAEVISLVLGLAIAFIRYTSDKLHIMRLGNLLAKLYLTIIRGTPSVIQLLIIYYVIFASTDINKIVVAIVAFGLNSAAYTAEIIRAGWNSVDNGQYEAGRSMGFNYFQTMRLFILPQAFKNVVPTLGNELIVLVKETAISGYIGIFDLTRAGDFIRSRTYEALLPLLTVALVYLMIIIILSLIVSRIERMLNKNEKQ